MSRHRLLALFAAVSMCWIILGCDHKPNDAKTAPASQASSRPVLSSDDDAKTIIDKVLKAYGGENAFARWSCGYLKYKTNGDIVPSMLGDVTTEDTFQFPGHLKRVVHMVAGGQDSVMIFVIHDGKGWMKRGNAPTEPMDNSSADNPQHPFALYCNLSFLNDADVRLTKLSVENVNGSDAIGIHARSARLGEMDLYFSLQTGLLVKTRKSVAVANVTKSSNGEAFLEGYHNVQGTEVPTRIRVMLDEKATIGVTLIEVKFADKFEEGTFAKP